MVLSAAERVLLHLHGLWNAREASREMTQAGISEGAQILRSHVPRSVQALIRDGLVEMTEAHLQGRARRTRVYRLTEAGVRRARQLLASVDATRVDVDGRKTTLGEARESLGLSPVAAILAVDPAGRLTSRGSDAGGEALIQRDADLAALRRWMAGPAPVAVVYGSKGMGKTSLGRAFSRMVPRSAWIDLAGCPDLLAFATEIERATGRKASNPMEPHSVSEAFLGAFEGATKLLVLDGFSEPAEELVEFLTSAVRGLRTDSGAKLLVLAQETTPAYCRFYGRGEVEAGIVHERHLRGLDLDGCRAMLANPSIDGESLRRIFLLTKGCPLYLKFIREGDEAGLKAHSRFTKAEIRLLLYSGGALRASPSAS